MAQLSALEERIEQLELRGRGPRPATERYTSMDMRSPPTPPLEFGPLGEDQVLALLCADTAAGAPPAEFPGSNESEYENEFQA